MIGNILNNKREYIYSYDYKNRLVKVEKIIYKTIEGNETNEIEEIVKIIQYRYDNLDRRIQKIFNNGSYRNYYYLNKDIILEENTNKKGKIKTSKYYINGNNIDDVLIMEKIDYKIKKVKEEYTNKKGKIKTKNIRENYTETNLYYYHKNHLNSIVAITDNSGNIVEEYEYDVFGKPYSKDLLTGKITNLKKSSIGNTRLFTGREYERGLQLYYNRARYYNSLLSRFISRDPIDISDDVNLYSYVGNNPIGFVDLMGTESKPLNPPKTAAEHYARNILNVDLPETYSDAIKQKWILLDESESVFHSFGNPEGKINYKFISNDGHREAVYHYKTGELITTPENMGTYNYYPPSEEINHFLYDIKPYYKYGNSISDYTTETQRQMRSTETTYSLYTNVKEADYNLKKFNQIDFVLETIKYFKY